MASLQAPTRQGKSLIGEGCGPAGRDVQRARLVGTGMSACGGCGHVQAVHGGPTHAYIGASSACWALQERLRTDIELRNDEIMHRLMNDAYAVQHPGKPERRSVQSVGLHLMSLCVVLERGAEDRRVESVLGSRPARRRLCLHWLEPPRPNGVRTVADALVAERGDERAAAVCAWAEDVWAAWTPHHATVRGWLDG
jgi:hypothetical protein